MCIFFICSENVLTVCTSEYENNIYILQSVTCSLMCINVITTMTSQLSSFYPQYICLKQFIFASCHPTEKYTRSERISEILIRCDHSECTQYAMCSPHESTGVCRCPLIYSRWRANNDFSQDCQDYSLLVLPSRPLWNWEICGLGQQTIYILLIHWAATTVRLAVFMY